jgi:hypothetical protein
MTEPANPDKWEPLQTPPGNVLIASIDRGRDQRLIKAFELAKCEVGRLFVNNSPDSPVRVDGELPVADVYQQMEQSGVTAFCTTGTHEHDFSFFFLRGAQTIIAFNAHLLAVNSA